MPPYTYIKFILNYHLPSINKNSFYTLSTSQAQLILDSHNEKLTLYEPFFWSDEAILFKLPYLTAVGYKNNEEKKQQESTF
jgi:hypothetical protein